jgi:MFS family permease
VSDAPATAPCRSVVSDLCSWRFAQLWLMIIMSATSGINIASSYKTFALKQPNLNSEAFLALVGSIAALGGNAAGRVFLGAMSDKFGFRRCFLTLTALQASTMLVYRKLAERRLTFALGTQAMLFCMSGNFVMFPAHCFRTFGANGAAVYSFLFTAFGSAALLGPVLTKALLAKGGYALAYNVFAALSLLALLLGSLV